jgi:serine/threonine protein kinase
LLGDFVWNVVLFCIILQPARRLGGGGFGDVYLCRNVCKNIDCAVKIVRECASDAESEAQKQAQCSHPNVVRLDRVHYSPQAQVCRDFSACFCSE